MSDRTLYTIPNENWFFLGKKGRERVTRLREWMREIASSRKVEPACRAIAERVQGTAHAISDSRLRKLWNAYSKAGELALVDHIHCGGKCGLPGCPGRPKGNLEAETVDYWITLAEKNDKLSLTKAHRMLIDKLREGEAIPGAGTWRAIFERLNPYKPQPRQCPWSLHRPPPGWSLANFLMRRPAHYESDGAKKGLAKMENTLVESLAIRTDLSGLRFMEVVAFDDHRLDCKAYVTRNHNGRMISTLVELWSVWALDLATRTVLAWGVRPRIESDDGTKESLTRRDVQHLIAGMLDSHGLPKDYQCTLLVENAAAAITPQFETDLSRVTDGRVVVHRTGVGSGRSIGYAEAFGKPRDKRWIESFFNLLEIEIGSIKGQMGNKWENRRGDFNARENIGKKLAHLGVLPSLPEAARPFEFIQDAMMQVQDAVLRMENREQHELVNFRTVREWRTGECDTWKSCDEPFFLALPLEQQNALLADDRTGLTRQETPAERRAWMRDPAAFTRLSEAALAFMYLDVAVVRYEGLDAISFEFAGSKFEFSGTLQKSARVGEKLTVRFDADNPTHCAVEDERGRVLGAMRIRHAPAFFEQEARAEQLGERQKIIGKALKNIRRRHSDIEQLVALKEATPIITAATQRPADVQRSNKSTRAALAAYVGGEVSKGSSSEEYLKRASLRRKDVAPQSLPAPVEVEAETDAPSVPSW
jgi:hypothetical protein